jgi:hypothetical protein
MERRSEGIPEGYAAQAIEDLENYLRELRNIGFNTLTPSNSLVHELEEEENQYSEHIKKSRCMLIRAIQQITGFQILDGTQRFQVIGFDGFFLARNFNQDKSLVIRWYKDEESTGKGESIEYEFKDNGTCKLIRQIGAEKPSSFTDDVAERCLEFCKSFVLSINENTSNILQEEARIRFYRVLKDELGRRDFRVRHQAPPFVKLNKFQEYFYSLLRGRGNVGYFPDVNYQIEYLEDIDDRKGGICIRSPRMAIPGESGVLEWRIWNNGELRSPNGELSKECPVNYHEVYKDWAKIIEEITK